MERLFVYGTLKDPKIQKKVIGRTSKGHPETLKGYKKSKVRIYGETYPILIPSKSNKINGLVLNVTNKELKLIDKYETKAYKRKKIALTSTEKAWTYLKPA